MASLLLVTLLLRAFIPAGYMIRGAGNEFALDLCSNYFKVATNADDKTAVTLQAERCVSDFSVSMAAVSYQPPALSVLTGVLIIEPATPYVGLVEDDAVRDRHSRGPPRGPVQPNGPELA